MRYDKEILLEYRELGEYDQVTGNYSEKRIVREQRWANVTDVGEESASLIYGKLPKGGKVVRLRCPISQIFDRVIIDGKAYNIDRVKHLIHMCTLIVSEANYDENRIQRGY